MNVGKSASTGGGGLVELRQRLLFVLIGIVVFRIGAHIPVPGIDLGKLSQLFNQSQIQK